MAEKNYAERKSLREAASKLYSDVVSAFKEKDTRSNNIDNYWDIYNCKLTDKQQYDGDSMVYVPVVHDAIEARVKRYTSMLMPSTGQTIDVSSETGDTPFETIAVMQHYVRRANLRTLLPGLFRRGDVEGQWSVFLEWKETRTKVRRRVEKPDPDDPSATIIDMEDDEIVDVGPTVTIIPDQDLAIVPPTATSIDDADMVIDVLRFSETRMKEMVESGEFVKSQFELMTKGVGTTTWAAREAAKEAGVRMKGGNTYYHIYRVWTKFKIDGERVPAIIYLGGDNCVLAIEKNPYWSKKIPILTAPVDLIPGSIWGKSKIAPVEQLAYQCNDAINMGMDSAKYSVLPIVMTDPIKNPNVGSMVLAAAAIWETNPNDTQFAQFPALWKDSFAMVSAIKAQINESMDVNDAMLGRAPAGRKNAQAIAQAESASVATIADTVRRFESAIMDEMLEWFFEMDQQFRDDDLLIRTEGELGLGAKIQRVPPSAFNQRYFFKWNGVEQSMGAQRVQQMLSFMNVLRGMPPQSLNGRTLDMTPIIDYAAEVVLGPTVAPRVIIDNRNRMTVDPEIENEIMYNGMDVEVSPMDDDQHHLQVHQELARHTGDPAGHIRRHMMKHAASMQAKGQMLAPPPPKGLPGVPGMGPPGVAGTPRLGAVPAGPRGNVQNPPGAIHQDQMQDPSAGMRG
jgi:hypothetical protein